MAVFCKNRKGFSLIEIAIALAVAGLIMAAVIQARRITTVVNPIRITRERFAEIDVALQKFLAMNGRLPCPSRPELNIGDEGVGIEVCDFNKFKSFSRLRFKSGYSAPTIFIPTCNPNNDADNGGGYCKVVGDGRGGRVIIQGGLPYKTLGLSPDNYRDGWSVNLRYVVTEVLTNATTYDKDMGAIYVVDSSQIKAASDTTKYRKTTLDAGDDNFNKLYPAPYGSGQFLLMSSGGNRAGAYIYSGIDVLVSKGRKQYECSAGDTAAGVASDERINFGLDFENCNQDAYFLTDDKFAMMDKDNIAFNLDDIVHDKFSVEPYADGFWGFSGNVDTPLSPSSIRNAKSSGRIGIGTDVPSVPLDVNGNLKADKIVVKELCKEDSGGTEDCFYPASILTNAKCSGRQSGLLMSISGNGNFNCMNSTFTNVIDNTCAAGWVVRGIDSSGAVICETE